MSENLNSRELNLDELEQVAGGKKRKSNEVWVNRMVVGTKNFLAIRTAAAYDDENIIGKLHNGDRVMLLLDKRQGSYVWVRSDVLNKEGWVNGNYLR